MNADLVYLARVLKAEFDAGLTLQQIAERWGMDVWMVSRLLARLAHLVA